jgi:hypothetical protein
MKNAQPEKKAETVETLIAAEVDAALGRFRAGNFKAEVRKRIEREERTTPWRPSRALLARPASVAAAAVILVIVAALVVLRRPAPRPNFARSIEDILRLAPGIKALEAGSMAPRPSSEETPAASDAVHLAALIAGSRTSEAPPPSGGIEIPARRPLRIRPLSLEEIYKIVSVDKSIERVLTFVTS